MPTYSSSQTFWAYEDKDGTLVTPLYDGQAPATKYLIDRLERPLYADPAWKFDMDYTIKEYRDRLALQKDHFKKLRDKAREGLKDYVLVTFKLVRNVPAA